MSMSRPAAPAPRNQADPGLPAILDDLTRVIEAARAMPMSSSVLVNKAEALALVDELRSALPGQLARADEVLAEAQQVLADTQRQADDVLAAARARAIELVGKEEVVLAAQERAAQIIADAEQRATELKVDADDYCDRRLADFEVDLGKIVAQVQAGRAKLADRLGAGLMPQWPSTHGESAGDG